jgi:hypothetical protein
VSLVLLSLLCSTGRAGTAIQPGSDGKEVRAHGAQEELRRQISIDVIADYVETFGVRGSAVAGN